MLELFIPKYEDLWFRKSFLGDEDTMSYNHAWGGTIDFSEEKWASWYERWIEKPQAERFYRYLQDTETKEFIGEAAYHLNDGKYMADVVIFAKYRNKGYGKEGLRLLCEAAKSAGIKWLYDDIAIDNPAVPMFLKRGFCEEYRTDDIIMLKKRL